MGNGATSSFNPSTYLTNIKGAKDSGETNYILTGINGNGGDITTTASVPITLVSSSNKASTKLYLLGATSQTTKGVAGYSNSAVFINTSDQLEATSGFKGNLIGNVTGDVTGNVSGTAGSVAWANVSGHPTQIVQGGAGTVSATNYSIQLYDMNGATIVENTSDSTVNGVIKVPIDRVGSTNKTGTKLFIIGTTSQDNTAQGYSNSGIYITTGNKIHGDLEGKADTAGTADTANAVTWSNVSGKPGQFIQGAGGTTGNTTYTIQLYNTDGQAVATNSTSALNGVLTIPIAKISSAAATNTKLFLVGATSQTGYASDGRSHVNYYIDTDNKLHGTTFVGALEGNADTATSATSAEKDGSNNIITNTYLSNVTGAADGLNYKLTFARPNNASAVIINVPQNTVGNKKVTTKLYWVGVGSTSTTDTVVTTNTDAAIYATNGTLTATKFVGNLEGNVTGNVSGTAGAIAWDNITGKPQIVKGAKGTTDTTKYTIQLYNTSGATIAASATAAENGVIEIPAATDSIAGLVTTAAQTFAGTKTFSTGVTITATSGFLYSGIETGTSAGARPVWFAYSGVDGKPVVNSNFTYNPSGGELKVGKITTTGTITAGSTMSATELTLSSGNDSEYSTEAATLKVTGGVSVSKRLSAKVIRIDNGETATTKGFNLIYDTTQECLKFQFGN